MADYGLPPEVNTLLTQFAGVKQHLWDTPQVKGAVKKAKKLVTDKHGKDVADEFDTKLAIARATACSSPSVMATLTSDSFQGASASKTRVRRASGL